MRLCERVFVCGCCCVCVVRSTSGVFFLVFFIDLIVFSLILYFCFVVFVRIVSSYCYLLIVNSLINNKGYHLWGGFVFFCFLFACCVGCGFGYLFWVKVILFCFIGLWGSVNFWGFSLYWIYWGFLFFSFLPKCWIIPRDIDVVKSRYIITGGHWILFLCKNSIAFVICVFLTNCVFCMIIF